MLDIRNMDCMDLMAEYPDKHFELAIVDPPYGIGESGEKTATRKSSSKAWKNQTLKAYKKGGWDKKPPSKAYFIELLRVSKNQIIWGANHFIENIPNANSSNWIVWYKAGQNPNTDFSDCEIAWGSFKTAIKYIDLPWVGFGAVNLKEHRIHPTQKPVKLYRWLLENYAQPGDKILDTHLGSGSIAIACHYMGFDLTACELDKDYYEAAMKRIEQETAQLSLL